MPSYTVHGPVRPRYNHSGAGFPDISAQAIQFDVCTDDFFYPAGPY